MWEELKKKIDQLKPILSSEHHFGAFTEEGLLHLKVGSHLLPGTVGHDSSLIYVTDSKDKRLPEAYYKKYLNLVQGKVAELLEKCKEHKEAATSEKPLTKNCKRGWQGLYAQQEGQRHWER